jgi:poly-gamma-glutamate capsule biosynthesis protein CapA/YwtB (metallophosphatase superfamily)
MKWRFYAVAGVSAALVAAVALAATKKPASPGTEATPSGTAQTTVASTASPTPTPRAVSTETVTLLFGGDIMLGRTVEKRIKSNGDTWPFDSLASTLTNADITAANLESPLRTDAVSTESGSLVLRGYPPGLKGVQKAGIDLVTLANNHIPDMGLVGLQETQKLLDADGIAHTGAGETDEAATVPSILTRRGMKIGFLAYTYGVNFDRPGVHYNVATPEAVTKGVTALLPQVDAVVVFCHCGTEYQPLPNQMQKDVAHAAIDAGASLFIGAHPHVPEPFEAYKNGLIIYSLGNLVFDQDPGNNRDHSALAQITLKGNMPTGLKLIPYHIFDRAQPRLITDATEKKQVFDLFKLPTGQWP